MQNLILAITNPRQLFENNKEDHEFVLPMILILVIVGVCGALSMFAMDYESIIEEAIAGQEQMLRSLGQSDEQIAAVAEQTRQQAGTGPNVMQLGGALIGGPIGIFIMVLLWAVYFKIVASAMNLGGSFGDWHAFVWWTRVPVAVGAIVTLIANFLTNPGSTAEMSVLSFAYWFGLEPNMFSAYFLYSFDLISVWTIIVAGIGFSVWTEKPLGISILIAALPVVVLFVLTLFLGTM